MIIADNIAALYEKTLMFVLRGDRVGPRGMMTIEQPNTQLMLTDLRNNVLLSKIRNLNYRFMVAEWLWILFGRDDVASITRYNSNMRQFSDDGYKFEGAYGPRIGRQAPYLMRVFNSDRNTRQAVITIWSPSPDPSKDIPCTISMQFLWRDDKLNCIVTMRSSDAWFGLLYDIFVFSQMTNYYAMCLGMRTGWLAMNLGSCHLYLDHPTLGAESYVKATDLLGSGTKYLTSPILQIHAPQMLNHMLHGEDCGEDDLIHDPSFRMYGNVLVSKTRAEALQWLSK